jgi:phosphate transport system substrate-binding protein
MSRKLSVLIFTLVLVSIAVTACAPAPASAEGSPTQNNTQTSSGTPAAQTAKLAPGSIQITGSGSTFAVPIYTEWIYAYQYIDPSVAINYQGIGSGGGKKAVIDGTVDFAGSDSVLSDAEYTSGKDLQMYPTAAGPVAFTYNIEGVAATDPVLVLDRNTLVGIYSGTIKTWNDPAIVALNPGLATKLPAKTITAAHRSDGSGTTEIVTNALSAFSADWKTNVGAGQSVAWPIDKAGNGVGGKGNQGVAAAVQNTPDSIGYVELSYAVQNKMPMASLINKAGKTVQPSVATTQAAMTDFADKFTSKLTAVIVDGPGDNSYPVVGYTYLILHTTSMTDCTKAQKLLEFFKWALTDASAGKRAADLGYAVLPAAVQQNVLSKFNEVTCKGNPVLSK